MKKIDGSLNEFLNTVTNDFNRLIVMIDLMKDNMAQLKAESSKSQQEHAQNVTTDRSPMT